jgi:hypothetical protein
MKPLQTLLLIILLTSTNWYAQSNDNIWCGGYQETVTKPIDLDKMVITSLINEYREFEQDSVYLGIKILDLFKYKGNLIYEVVGDISYRWEFNYKLNEYSYTYYIYQYRHYTGAGFGEFVKWLEEKYK